jgi:cob(I)alamin adenosyltransferase
MGNRLTKIYTRTGDDGTTGLGDGERVDKCDPRVEAYGAVDEINSALGAVLSAPGIPESVANCLNRVQHELFDLGGELSLPSHRVIGSEQVQGLEADLDMFNEKLPPLENFILPGGTTAAASCHLARTICRRAERVTWALKKKTELNPEIPKYLNRLSDLLFVAARVLARQDGGTEVLWKQSP